MRIAYGTRGIDWVRRRHRHQGERHRHQHSLASIVNHSEDS
jgi:hypothetical protein